MGQSSHEQLKLGRISFLNVLPIYYPLEMGIVSHPFTIISGTPAYLNGLMARNELDLSVVSSIEYARYPERYFILPDLSISCCGAVKSVLLLSQLPIPELAGQNILVSTQSHTSVALLKILFAERLQQEARFIPANCTEVLAQGEQPAAFLAIGDEALHFRHHDSYPYRWDLGEAWREWTGLPFVFALWVLQRKAIEKWNGRLAGAVETLAAAKEWGRTHRGLICQDAMGKGILGYQELQDYYQRLYYNLSEQEQKGLQLFYHYLTAIGEIGDVPRLEIYSPLAHVA